MCNRERAIYRDHSSTVHCVFSERIDFSKAASCLSDWYLSYESSAYEQLDSRATSGYLRAYRSAAAAWLWQKSIRVPGPPALPCQLHDDWTFLLIQHPTIPVLWPFS